MYGISYAIPYGMAAPCDNSYVLVRAGPHGAAYSQFLAAAQVFRSVVPLFPFSFPSNGITFMKPFPGTHPVRYLYHLYFDAHTCVREEPVYWYLCTIDTLCHKRKGIICGIGIIHTILIYTDIGIWWIAGWNKFFSFAIFFCAYFSPRVRQFNTFYSVFLLIIWHYYLSPVNGIMP